MSHEDLRTLLTNLAEEVDHMPQREYTAPAWAKAHQVRRRRVILGAAAAVVLIAVPVAVLLPRDEPGVRPAEPTSAPLRARAAHTATLLGDGRVLIVGGCATDGCTTADASPTTEYYTPGQGFTAGPELLQPRQGHSATMLADGRVLVAGGWPREGTGPLDSAEVYDPDTGQFEPVGPMTMPRGGLLATALPDGRVLIVGGGDDPTATELFDPGRDAFTPAAPMPDGIGVGGAIALPDGRVLVVGGQDEAGDAQPGALYDPKSDTWQPTGTVLTPRSRFALAPLPGGRVLVIGGNVEEQGRRSDESLLATTEIYEPGTGTFTVGPSMEIERYKLTAAVDADGRVIVAGGTQAAVYDPASGQTGRQFDGLSATRGDVRWFPTATVLPNGDVLIVGGYGDRIQLFDDAFLVSANDIAAAASGE
jgi:hypothetical protein